MVKNHLKPILSVQCTSNVWKKKNQRIKTVQQTLFIRQNNYKNL